MKTRLGKIAQLPKSIRDDLNHRLENGKQGPELLEWLNNLPETKELLTQKFDNQPITRSNLSDWRQGGFEEWRADQIRQARIQRICETGGSLEQAEAGDLFENFARITIAEMMVNLDAVQKLRGEKRAERMHHLVRDLSRLQNAYNRSRWADLAWTKYNDNNSATVDPPASSPAPDPRPSTLSLPPPVACRADVSAIASATAEALAKADAPASLPTVTSSSASVVVPDRAESQAGDPNDLEPKPNQNGMDVLHFTNCNCDEPCPKCHAPESAYPLDEAIRDRRYYRKHGRNPCDRHGKSKFLINVACDCACDRCAEKTATTAPTPNVILACRAEALAEAGRVALPRDPIIDHAEARDEKLASPTTTPQPAITPSVQLTDFTRRMALLKTVSQ